MGFFKNWAANAKAMQVVQKELTIVMAKQGVNFMNLHPEITKFLMNSAVDEGAEFAVDKLDDLVERVRLQSPDMSVDQIQKQVVSAVKIINEMPRR